ncbi:MAG: PLP-dependent cysteine synthase family protein [Clostridia bacterium]|nr:PLP-dependent cysteine synthase family protein [Clostridia bacterium]
MAGGIYDSALKTIGNTPLIELRGIKAAFSLKADLYGKAEYLNPTGSVKDRSALFMIKGALEKGMIGRDFTVIEVTGGNSAVSMAMVCAALSLSCVIVMPDDTPKERIATVEAYGAKVLTTPARSGTEGAKEAAQKLKERLPRSAIFDPFESEDNAEAHRAGTAKELLKTGIQIDYIVAGIGTGGTITGCAEIIRRHYPDCAVIGVEPADSPVISGGFASPHGITGIGAGFIPPILNTYILDEVIKVRMPDALDAKRYLIEKEGICCGISSGAALVAAINVAQREEARGKNVVCILPDKGF